MALQQVPQAQLRHMSLSLDNCAEKLAGRGAVRYQAADSCPPAGADAEANAKCLIC